MGFLLGSQDARIVLASEQCYKALQRGPNGEILSFSGWPRVTWINTDHHASGTKPPKDWTPPDRLTNDATMYLEVSIVLLNFSLYILIYIKLNKKYVVYKLFLETVSY